MKDEFKIYNGDLFIDDRGELGFVNDCDLSGVRRFYTVANHAPGFIRAWHGHKKEAKYITVTSGALLLAAVKIDNWENPSKDLEIERTVLSAKKPSMVYVPGGYAHGHMSLTEDTKIVVMSTTTIDESKDDDYRFPADYWNPWEIIER